jgi:hypothetical protein
MKERQLKVGDRIKDNDPRMVGRKLIITAVYEISVRARGLESNIEVSIRKDRIHQDGKPRRGGFDLLKDSGK